jgi:hypothetical protein
MVLDTTWNIYNKLMKLGRSLGKNLRSNSLETLEINRNKLSGKPF